MSRRPRPYAGVGRAALPAELTQEIATTRDGRDITRPWVGELEEYRDRRLLGAIDWGVYNRIRKDDQVKSCMEQRRSAVVSREWSMIPGDPDDRRAVAAAEAAEANLQRLDWDGITNKMLWVSFHGIAIAETVWGHRDGLWQWDDIKVRHARRFRFDKDGNLRLLTVRDMARGELQPVRKYWIVTAGATDDDEPYGEGLADWLYWPTLFKRNGIRFWNLFLDKFSLPTARGTYPRGTSKEEIAKLLQSMAALANDSGIAVPEGVVLEFMQIATQGVDFEKMPRYMDEAIAKIILSQTMTTEDGSSRAQGQVHEGVKQELITADADLLSGSFNRGPLRWFTDFNFGEDVASPQLIRQVEEEDDTKATAETDVVLDRMGFERTEESFKDVYGDGYQRKAAPAVPAKNPSGTRPEGGTRDGSSADEDSRVEGREASFAAEDLRPLYVYRRLKNARDLIAWAQKAGFASTLAAGDMHVTLAYSRRPVNWFAMGGTFGPPSGEITVSAGGPRRVEKMGDQGAVALVFGSPELQWRHEEMVKAGAGWDHADYYPHVTITYAAGDVDLAAVEPYQGKLVFGPETFEAIDEDWTGSVEEVSFADPSYPSPLGGEGRGEGDIVDQAATAIMADEGWKKVAGDLGVSGLVDQLASATTPDEVHAILARAAELPGSDAFVEQLARASFAVRMAGATGEDA
jgi:hypothetical protein